jgi:hypothetical protein
VVTYLVIHYNPCEEFLDKILNLEGGQRYANGDRGELASGVVVGIALRVGLLEMTHDV